MVAHSKPLWGAGWGWPKMMFFCMIVWKQILTHIWVTEALNMPQIGCKLVSFLTHIVSILYEGGFRRSRLSLVILPF